MQNYRMLIFLIPLMALILESIRFTNAEPKPLVSSSGMITMKEPKGNLSESSTTTPQPPAVAGVVLEPISTTPIKQSILLRSSSGGGEISVVQKVDNHPDVPDRPSVGWSNNSVATSQTHVPLATMPHPPPPSPSNVTLNHDLIRAYQSKNDVEVIKNAILTESLSAGGGTSLTPADHGSQNQSLSHGVSGKRDVEAQEGFDENDTVEEGDEDDGDDKLPVFGDDEINEAVKVGNASSDNEKLVMTFEEDNSTEASSIGSDNVESTNPGPRQDPLPVGFSFDENESAEATEAGSDEDDESVEATIVGNGEDELPSSHGNKLVLTFDEDRGKIGAPEVVSNEGESARISHDPFPVEFPFDEEESAEATIAGSGEDESVEATVVGNGEDELPNPNNNQLGITFEEYRDQKPPKGGPATHTDSYPGEDFKTTPTDPVPIYKLGPPWEDEKIIGGEPLDGGVEQIEISFTLASKLCAAMDREYANSDIAYRVYLWAPINQYLPMIHKAFPVRSPLFAPECLKWAHRSCRGATRSPALKPCSYWAPMPIRRPECGFIPNQQDKMVNYRDPSYVPGNCPCVWPCLRKFDPIQRCRVKVSEDDKNLDEIEYSGDPKKGKELQIQINYAQQLCRSIRPTMKRGNLISISWLPIRITPIQKRETKKKKRSNNHSHKPRKHKSRKSKGSKHKKHLNKNGSKNHSSPKHARHKRHDTNEMLRNPKHFHNKRFTSQLPIEVNNNDLSESEEPVNLDEPVEEADDITLAGSFNPDRFSEEAQSLPEDMNINATGETTNDKDKMDTYNDETNELEDFQKLHLTSNSCHIWKYKTCLKRESSEELDSNEYQNPTIIEGDTEQQGSNHECGQWYYEESEDCTPEELVIEDGSELGPRLLRKPRVKNICPGNRGKFPCFLNRRKRLLHDTGKRSHLHTNKGKRNYDTIRVRVPRKGKSFRQPKKRGLFLEDLHDVENSTTSDEDGGGIPLPSTGTDGDNSVEEGSSSPSSFIRLRQDDSCRCDWPCLPFYDSINRCYDHEGNIIVDRSGKPIVPTRSFRKHQQDPVVCINFAENDEIYCKIKQRRRVRS